MARIKDLRERRQWRMMAVGHGSCLQAMEIFFRKKTIIC
jgi:hypothetical protein